MRRALGITALTAVAFALLAFALFDRQLTEERVRIAAVGTPNPVNVEAPVDLPAGKRLCMTRTLLSPRTEVAELVVHQGERPTPALEVVARGPGYRSPVARIPASDPGRHPVTARIQPPDHELVGELCVRAAERRPVRFVGTTEFRTISRSIASIDGEQIAPDVSLTFYTAEPVSTLDDLGGIVARMTIARGFLGADWIVWGLLALAFVGMPIAVLLAFGSSLRDAERRER